ncbi:MAG: hypothetical protein M3156_01650 [Thermoproteota archaeon]|nr:hypothetical protein [Thermoproteota archaeon]
MVESVKSTLDLIGNQDTDLLGNHIWDISEYDNIKIIRIYEAKQIIVMLAKIHTAVGDIVETVLGYFYESD